MTDIRKLRDVFLRASHSGESDAILELDPDDFRVVSDALFHVIAAQEALPLGTVVTLKSGGPPMTATYVGTKGDVHVRWFPSPSGEPQSTTFPAEALSIVRNK